MLFNDIYSMFLSRITDDLYVTLTDDETKAILGELFRTAILHYEFPTFDLNQILIDLASGSDSTSVELTYNEQLVITYYMMVEWLGRQLFNIDYTQQRAGGGDFTLNAPGPIIARLKELLEQYELKGLAQRRMIGRKGQFSPTNPTSFWDELS